MNNKGRVNEVIGNICDDCRSSFNPKKENRQKYLGLEHVNAGDLSINGIGCSDDTSSTKMHFNEGDILFGKMRPYFRKVIRPKFSGVCSSEFFVVRSTSAKVLQEYLFYIFANQIFVDAVNETTGGADRPRAKREVVKNFTVILPPLPTQQRIASILSKYDDLIENNTRRIAILEEQAQTLYRQWFVEYKFPGHEKVKMVDSGTEFGEIPEGWEMKNLSDTLAKIKRAKKVPKKEYLDEGEIPVIDQSKGYIAGYVNDSKYLQDTPSPCVVFGDHTRVVKFVPFPFASGADGTQLLYPKDESLAPHYFYLAIKNTYVQNYAYERHFKFLKAKEMLKPEKNVLSQFHKYTQSIYDAIRNLQQQSDNLKIQRDTLLPKLVSGEILVDA